MSLKFLFRLTLLSLLGATLLLGSCTDPGLCYESEHPHVGGVRFAYEWDEGVHPDSLDSMSVIAVRLINHQKRGMVVAVREPNHGHYFYNAPAHVEPWKDPNEPEPEPEPQDTGSINIGIDPYEPHNGGGIEVHDDTVTVLDPDPGPPGPYEANVERFNLSNGTYKFFTMSVDTAEIIYTNINEFLTARGDGMQATDIAVTYRTYARSDSAFNIPVKGWTDYNPAFSYIKSNFPPIYIDTIDMEPVQTGVQKTVTFHPKQLTQNIDIYFTILKDVSEVPFVIDSVWAEISGIPSRANLFSGHLYLAKTNKMMFSTEFVTPAGQPTDDVFTSDSVRVHANINVLSIMNSKDGSYLTGPGILQLLVYARAQNGDRMVPMVMQARTNIYRDLMDAELIEYDIHGQYATRRVPHAVLDLSRRYKISGRSIIDNIERPGGLDIWTEGDNRDEFEL